jgi:hypothetical protein
VAVVDGGVKGFIALMGNEVDAIKTSNAMP